MADFVLARESIVEKLDFDVLVTENENTIEQRRLRNTFMKSDYKIVTPDLTRLQAKQYRDWFIAKYGALYSFTILDPVDEQEYTVRFVQGTFQIIHQGGYFKCEFELKKVIA